MLEFWTLPSSLFQKCLIASQHMWEEEEVDTFPTAMMVSGWRAEMWMSSCISSEWNEIGGGGIRAVHDYPKRKDKNSSMKLKTIGAFLLEGLLQYCRRSYQEQEPEQLIITILKTSISFWSIYTSLHIVIISTTLKGRTVVIMSSLWMKSLKGYFCSSCCLWAQFVALSLLMPEPSSEVSLTAVIGARAKCSANLFVASTWAKLWAWQEYGTTLWVLCEAFQGSECSTWP